MQYPILIIVNRTVTTVSTIPLFSKRNELSVHNHYIISRFPYIFWINDFHKYNYKISVTMFTNFVLKKFQIITKKTLKIYKHTLTVKTHLYSSSKHKGILLSKHVDISFMIISIKSFLPP